MSARTLQGKSALAVIPPSVAGALSGTSWAARLRLLGLRLALPTVALLLWEVATGGLSGDLTWLDPALVGRPSRIAAELWRLVTRGTIFLHTAVTFQEALGGLFLAIVGGVTLGTFLAYSQSGSNLLLPYVKVLNSIPRLALAPFLIIWFGIGIASKVVLASLTAFFPIFFTTYQGIQNIETELVDALRVMGASRLQLLRMVVLPAVFSWILAGIRTSLGLALVGAIVSEYTGSTRGLGYLLLAAQGVLNVDRAWAILVVLAALGILLDWVTRALEARYLRWQKAPEGL